MTDSTPACLECDGALPPLKYRGNPRKYCSDVCSRKYRRRNSATYRERVRAYSRKQNQRIEASKPPRPRCRNCGAEMTRRKGATYCDAQPCRTARYQAKKASQPRCSMPACDRPVLARGYCGSHYKSEYYVPNFGEPSPTMRSRKCPCGVVVRSRQGRTKYCSEFCRSAWRDVTPSQSRCLTVWEPPLRYAPTVVIPPSQARRFSCSCVICGAKFLADGMHRTCSVECQEKNYREKLRRNLRKYVARHGRFAVDPEVRLEIYERDRWTCQLCGEETSRVYSRDDPKAPTLDHIVPRSLQLIPDDSPSNLRLACALCNSLRGNDVNWAPEAVASAS